MPTDVASNVSTTASLIINGGEVVGQTDFAADSDWYRVTLTAGVTYYFAANANGLLPSLTLRDANGLSLYGGSSAIAFTPEQSGTYYLDASRDILSASGDYSIFASSYHPVLGPSDVAGGMATTAALTVGGPITNGTFEDIGDSDWYSVHLEEGHTYEFVATNGYGNNPYVVLRDAEGNAITHSLAAPTSAGNNFGILNQNFAYANIVFTATATGDYFLDAQNPTWMDPSYEVQVHEFVPSEDPLNTIMTTNTVSADGLAVGGVFESAGDSDWYGIQLTAGKTYSFTIDTTSFSTLILRDQSGAFLDYSSVDVGFDPTFTFTATATGQYFLDASTRSYGGGIYNIVAQEISAAPAEIAGNSTTTAVLPLDGFQHRGEWEEGPDSDWYGVSLTAGVTYQFKLYVLDASGPLGAETRAALAVMDSNGHELQADVEQVYYTSGMMTVEITADQSGTYYVDARNLFDGEYALTGQELQAIPGDTVGYGADSSAPLPVDGIPVTATIDDYGDRDWYAVSLVAGHTYRFTTTGEPYSYPELELRTADGVIIGQAFGNGSVNASDPQQQDFVFTAATSGTYYLDLTGAPGFFEISATDIQASADVPGDATTPETLDLDVPVEVELGTTSDADWYAIQLMAGQSYSARLDTTDFTTAHIAVRDAAGHILADSTSNTDQNVFFRYGSSFSHFTAEVTGTYYVAVTDGPGTYTLDVVPDDYGDNADWVGSISPGTTDAAFENYYDADFFNLNVETGKIYTLSWSGTEIKGSLTIDGHTLTHLDEPFTFTASGSAPVFGANYYGLDPTASYSLSLTERTDIADDGNTVASATPISIGADANGSIDAYGDHDVFRIAMSAGKTYGIGIGIAATGDQTLDRFQFVIRDASGNVLASSSSYGVDTFHFAAPNTGNYYIDISNYRYDEDSAYDESTGTYRVRVDEDPAGMTPVKAIDAGVSVPDKTITVFFADSGYAYPKEVITRGDGVAGAWNAAEKAEVQAVLHRYENAVDIHFVEVNSAADADFVLVSDKDAAGSFFGAPGTSHADLGVFGSIKSLSLSPGGGFVEAVAEEIGRGLGLKAPDEAGVNGMMYNVNRNYPLGLLSLNQSVYTVMSPNSGWIAPAPFDYSPFDQSQNTLYGHQIGPAALDIAALQGKYGSNNTFNKGNNVYTLVGKNGEGTFWQALWDSGGTDEIRYNGFRDSVINLNAATGEYDEGGGGFVSNVRGVSGGLTIARHAIIENARGGTGDDVLIGNDVANTLTGNAGDDTIDGGLGKDIIAGGSGIDTASYISAVSGVEVSLLVSGQQNTFGAGIDRLDEMENLVGSKFADQLTGNRFDNLLDGNAGNDQVDGGGGDDQLVGRAGRDNMQGSAGSDRFVAVEKDGDDRYDGGAGVDVYDARLIATAITVDLSKGLATGLAIGTDKLTDIENVEGGQGGDTIIAGSRVNVFTGNAGDDLFVFRTEDDAGLSGQRDQITDFAVEHDHVDLSGIDASQSVKGNQAFLFAGLITSMKSGVGELERGSVGYRFFTDEDGVSHTLIEGNTGGSKAADFQIDLVGHIAVSVDGLIL